MRPTKKKKARASGESNRRTILDESVIKHLEQPQVGTITKLSQAIREGSKLRGECHSSWLKDGRSCAWTAAAEATGMDFSIGYRIDGLAIYRHLKAHFPNLTPDIFGDVVMRMDSRNWSRLRCANWLQALGY